MEEVPQELHKKGHPLFLKDAQLACFQKMRFGWAKKRAAQGRPLLEGLRYFEYTRWPRRFCCQHWSLCSVQKGFSLP